MLTKVVSLLQVDFTLCNWTWYLWWTS